jgi:hypothetical protein
MEPQNQPTKPRKIKWATYTVEDEAVVPPLKPYDLQPVTDIPIRLAVEQGYLRRKRDLSLFQLSEDWKGHPKDSIVIAGALEPGREYAVWIADDKEHVLETKPEIPHAEETPAGAEEPAGKSVGEPARAEATKTVPGKQEVSLTEKAPKVPLPSKIHVKIPSQLSFRPKRLYLDPRPIGDSFRKRLHISRKRHTLIKR